MYPLVAMGALVVSVACASEAASPTGEPPATTDSLSTTVPPLTPEERCAEALQWVANIGLPMPAGAGFRCPSTMFAHHGASCWYAAQCPDARFIAINTELMGDVSQTYLRYVVAHEICHMMHFDAGLSSTEPEADACAASYGARPAG